MHPWFRPLGRRLATLAVCIAWTAFEAWTQLGSLWFWLALAFSLYAGYLVMQPAQAFEEKA